MKRRSLLIAALLCTTLLSAVVAAVAIRGQRARTTPALIGPINFNREKCESIVRLIESGRLAERHGLVKLPAELADATTTGAVYVTHRGDAEMFLFEIAEGRGRNFIGYLYSAIPYERMEVTNEDDEGLNRQPMIEIAVEDSGQGTRTLVSIRSTDWPNWYEARFRLD